MFGMSAFNRKARQFTHIPIFYDPEKEVREQREDMAFGLVAWQQVIMTI